MTDSVDMTAGLGRMASPFFVYRAVDDAVLDGSTLDLSMDLGFGIYHTARVRLMGVESHDIYEVEEGTEEYEQARKEVAFLGQWLQDARSDNEEEKWPLIARSMRDRECRYGTYVAEVYRRDTSDSLNDAIRSEFPEMAV